MSIRVRRILAPVDFSESSGHSYDYAVALARAFEAEVHVLHVLDDIFLNAPSTAQQFRDDYEKEQKQKLEKLLGRRDDVRVSIETVMQPATPFYEII
jgi:nucleotide-binding universal stress UspA family protein